VRIRPLRLLGCWAPKSLIASDFHAESPSADSPSADSPSADSRADPLCSAARAVITTLAGTDWIFPSGARPAVDSPLGELWGVVVDHSGNLYISDRDNHMVLRAAANGILTVFAGNGLSATTGDGGPATSASLSFPAGLALDGVGNLFIADEVAGRIRKVAPDGTITTVAGGGRLDGEDVPATAVALKNPFGVAVDSSGTLYFSETGTQRVRKVGPDGIIVTIAGTGQQGFSGDGGLGTSATFYSPRGIALDLAGNLLIADRGNNRVRKLTPSGIISTIAGNSTYGRSGDGGPASNAALAGPTAIAIDSAGNIFVDSVIVVRRISTSGIITTVAGRFYGFGGDGGPALSADLSFVSGLTVDSLGALYISDESNLRVRKVANGLISTVAGNGDFRYNGDGGPATSATLNTPKDVVRRFRGRRLCS